MRDTYLQQACRIPMLRTIQGRTEKKEKKGVLLSVSYSGLCAPEVIYSFFHSLYVKVLLDVIYNITRSHDNLRSTRLDESTH